jgi:Uma2 family endonuclease
VKGDDTFAAGAVSPSFEFCCHFYSAADTMIGYRIFSEDSFMATAERVMTAEQRFLLHGINWRSYQLLGEALLNRHIRITYDRGDLEMMTVSREHERNKRFVGRLIEEFTVALDIPIQSAGSTTWQREDLERGLEPDECYYILNEPLVRFKEELDLAVDPPPDLALEVEVSRSMLDRVAIYAALGVPEIWRYDGRKLIICLLKEGIYVEHERSTNLPLLQPATVLRFVELRQTLNETACIRAFREWLAVAFPRSS